MKNILLLVHDDAGQEARVQAALDASRALDGHLECLDVAQVPVLFDDLNSSSAAMMLMDDAIELEKANRTALEARLAGEGVPWSWTDVVGNAIDLVIERSAMADLIVLNRRTDSASPDMHEITGAVVIQAGKPALVVSDHLKRFDPFGRALIAWDNSDAARAAMQASIPLLKLASEVRLFHVAESGKEGDLAAAALYLSRHGIHADVKQAFDDEHSVADVIAAEIARWGADWMVMGAFNHSRLREALFGGTTRQMLTKCSIPVILAH